MHPPADDASMRCHLGDVIGAPMLASRPVYRDASPRDGWVETLKHTFLAWLAALIFAVLILAFVSGLFLFASR